MSNMVELYEQSPDNLKVLNVFLFVDREKLVSVRVELRAIRKLESAQKLQQRKWKRPEC